MKVICISIPVRRVFGPDRPMPPLTVGEFYTVADEIRHGAVVFFSLTEFGGKHAFSSKHFAVLSNIDETELANELQTTQTA